LGIEIGIGFSKTFDFDPDRDALQWSRAGSDALTAVFLP
jgi:hypothetical protein